MANGYPNNDAIQKSLGLSDDEMRTVTQMAVWHFTDNDYNNPQILDSISKKQALALAILLDKADSTTVDPTALSSLLKDYKNIDPSYEVPDGFIPPDKSTLDLYLSNGTLSADHNKEYQNLLSGHLVKPDGSVIDIPRDNTIKNEQEITITKYGNNIQQDGAIFDIVKADDLTNVLNTFTSEKEKPNKIKLEVGSYILNEKTAPEGFQKINGIKFLVKADGNIEILDRGKNEDESVPDEIDVSSYKNNLYITDKEKPEGQEEPETGNKTKLIIRKYAKGDYKKLLEGAELELNKISDDEKEGTLVEGGNFKSGSKGKEFELEDGFYILKEKKAPNGYKVADDINIEVKNGKVLIDGEEALKDEESYIISMEDEAIGQTYIFFSKQDILGKELAGAKLEIIDKSTNDVIKEWVSDGSTTTFKLSEGSYKLVETAAPKGYKIATEINFAVDKDRKVSADEGS